MKWIRTVRDGGEEVGYVEDGRFQATSASTLIDVIAGKAWQPMGEAVSVEGLRYAPPLRPGKIVCVGANYYDHCRETNFPVPDKPVLFAKFNNTLAASGDAIGWSEGATRSVDFEAELGVVIGRTMRGVAKADALSHVFGYVAVNDVTARDVQHGDGQWIRGKSFDGFCPLGPNVTTADEVADPQALAIRCILNSQDVQNSSTREMIFPVDVLLEFISRTITLEPGDLVLTGTPAGVGAGREPPLWLKVGDRIEVVVEGVGHLVNTIRGPIARAA